MAEEHVGVADGDHVIVKHAGVDGGGILLREQDSLRVQLVQPRHGLRRFQCLSRRIAVGRRCVIGQRPAAVDE